MSEIKSRPYLSFTGKRATQNLKKNFRNSIFYEHADIYNVTYQGVKMMILA